MIVYLKKEGAFGLLGNTKNSQRYPLHLNNLEFCSEDLQRKVNSINFRCNSVIPAVAKVIFLPLDIAFPNLLQSTKRR